MNVNFDFILASKSPRRRLLLESLNFNFSVKTQKTNEKSNLMTKNPEKIALENAALKGKFETDDFVLSADTIVYIDNLIIGKPRDKNSALDMLLKLNGKTHTVITAVVLSRNTKLLEYKLVKTLVTFNKLPRSIYQKYLSLNTYKDKAGAYAIQDFSRIFVDNINGSFTNIIGLPIKETMDILAKVDIFPN